MSDLVCRHCGKPITYKDEFGEWMHGNEPLCRLPENTLERASEGHGICAEPVPVAPKAWDMNRARAITQFMAGGMTQKQAIEEYEGVPVVPEDRTCPICNGTGQHPQSGTHCPLCLGVGIELRRAPVVPEEIQMKINRLWDRLGALGISPEEFKGNAENLNSDATDSSSVVPETLEPWAGIAHEIRVERYGQAPGVIAMAVGEAVWDAAVKATAERCARLALNSRLVESDGTITDQAWNASLSEAAAAIRAEYGATEASTEKPVKRGPVTWDSIRTMKDGERALIPALFFDLPGGGDVLFTRIRPEYGTGEQQ